MKKVIKTVVTCWAAYFVTSYVAYGVSDNLKNTGKAMLESKKRKLNGEEPLDMEIKPGILVAIDNLKEFTDDLKEHVLFHKKTDEQMMQENIDAIQEQESEQAVEAQTDAN